MARAGPRSSGVLDAGARDHLFSAAYDELRRLAASVRREDPSRTLNPTALVNEAWLKLVASSPSSPPPHRPTSSGSPPGPCVRCWWRRRGVGRRASAAAARRWSPSTRTRFPPEAGSEQVLALDSALESLARLEPRQALIVESRFFGGLDVRETCEVLGVSEATVLRDWRAARAFLAHELRHTG